MKSNIKIITNKFSVPVLTLLLVGLVFTSCSDVAGPDSQVLSQSIDQSIDGKVEITGNALDEKGKVYVCKFTRTPGSDRMELKKGNQGLVHVSANSLRNVGLNNWPEVNVGDYWTDEHGKHGVEDADFSKVIDPAEGAFALESGDVEAVIEACGNDGGTSGDVQG